MIWHDEPVLALNDVRRVLLLLVPEEYFTLVAGGISLPAINQYIFKNQRCGSGEIQSGSGSSILAQSGSTKSLKLDPMRIWIYNRTFETNFFEVFKIKK
jgi:hypothetical protein